MARKKFDVITRTFLFDGDETDAATTRVEGFLATVAGNATAAMGPEGIVLTTTTEASSAAHLYRSATGVIPLGDCISVEFLFELNDMTANTDYYLGLAYDGTDATAATAKVLAKIDQLTLGAVAHDGTTAYSATSMATLVAGTWYTLKIDLNYEILTQSPPALSKAPVAVFSIEDSRGYQRKLDTGTTVFNLAAGAATRVAPIIANLDLTADTETPDIICRMIKWKYRI